MITITRRIEFDAAHRLRNHESQCRYMHGHRYVLEASFSAPELDGVGRVVDFGVVREVLGGWIEAHWDHTLILWDEDKELGGFVDGYTGQTTFYLPYNPTAENMAKYLFEQVIPGLFKNSAFACTGVRLYETPNCHAEVTQ